MQMRRLQCSSCLLQDKLSLLRLKLLSLTLHCKPTECKQGQGGRTNLTSLSHFNDWTGLSEGCAHYCRMWWWSLVSPLFTRLSKCILLFAALRPLKMSQKRKTPLGFWAWICSLRLPANFRWESV